MEFFYCLLARTQASFHVEGGGSLAVEDGELAGSLEYLTYSHPSLHYPANQLCATLQYLTNQPDPPAITHRWRGPPSFSERGLCFVAVPQLCRKPAFFWKAGFGLLVIGWYW